MTSTQKKTLNTIRLKWLLKYYYLKHSSSVLSDIKIGDEINRLLESSLESFHIIATPFAQT